MKQKLLNSLRLQLCTLVACLLCAFNGQAWGEEKTITLDFEEQSIPASLWEWDNFTVTSDPVTNHSSFCASTNKKTTAVITYKSLIPNVKSISVQATRTSTNTNTNLFIEFCESSNFNANVSSQQCTSIPRNSWGTNTLTLEQPEDGYIRIRWAGTSAEKFIDNIVITYEEGPTKTDPELAFSAETVTATIGQSFTAPTLTNTHSVTPITWTSSNVGVATVSDGTVTLVGEGTTTITASFAGNNDYLASAASYTLNVTDPSFITLWSEDFSSYDANDVPSGGTYGYACTSNSTKIYDAILAGGVTPELLVGKSGGTFTAIVPLNNASGTLTLTYKTNAKALKVSTPTPNISIVDAGDDGSISYNTSGEHTVTFTGVTTSMTSITIVFTATSGENVRLDDIELRGHAQAVLVEAPTFSVVGGTYYTAQSVELSCATDGATIYYSTDGENYSPYTSAIPVSATTTVYAKAEKDGNWSTVSSSTYTIAEKNNVVFNIENKTLAIDESYTVTFGTNSGRDVQSDGYVSLSSDNAVVTIDNTKVTAAAVGTATITITVTEGATYKAGATTFTVTVPAPEGQTTAPTGAGSIFEEHFNAAEGTGGNEKPETALDDLWSGNIASSKFVSDNEGWTYPSNNSNPLGYVGYQCAKFGNGKNAGYGTTPNITATVGATYTLSFKAAPWDQESTAMNVTATGATISGISTSNMTTNQWNDFTATVTATEQTFKLTFAATNNRFFLDEIVITDPNAPASTISYTIPSSGYGTFCSEYPIDLTKLPEGVKVYAVENHDGNKATLAEITDDNIKGGVGFVIEGEGNKTVEFSFTDSENEPNNELVGTLAPTYLELHTAYGLKGGKFQPNSAGTMRANRAYLPNTTNGVKALVLEFRDSTTGITHTRTLTNEEAEQIFNIAGQRMNEMQKGINIVGGKKVLVK